MKQTYTLILILLLGFSAFAEKHHTNFIPVQDSLSEEVHILSNPVHQYHFGGACGFAAIPPKGKIAIEKLLKNKAYEAIESVLDGRNIEGQLFAIEALLELSASKEYRLSKSTKKKIKTIIEADYTFQRCQGCVISDPTTMELFREYKYARLLKKSDIWVSKKSGTKLRLPSTF